MRDAPLLQRLRRRDALRVDSIDQLDGRGEPRCGSHSRLSVRDEDRQQNHLNRHRNSLSARSARPHAIAATPYPDNKTPPIRLNHNPRSGDQLAIVPVIPVPNRLQRTPRDAAMNIITPLPKGTAHAAELPGNSVTSFLKMA